MRKTVAIVWMLATASVCAVAGSSPVADAVERGDKQALAALLKAGADVNAAQGDGATALHWAAYQNDAKTVALLLGAGAKLNAQNDLGVTPFALAAQQG